MTALEWDSLEREGHERAEVEIGSGIRICSTVTVGDERWTYRVDSGTDEIFRSVRLESPDGRTVVIDHDGSGGWVVDGTADPRYSNALEIDLRLTPTTNTLALRRLRLGIGNSADIDTVFVDFPSLEVRRDPQRYTRLGDRTYRFESRDTDFRRDIEVDGDGFVVHYPGLFMRRRATIA